MLRSLLALVACPSSAWSCRWPPAAAAAPSGGDRQDHHGAGGGLPHRDVHRPRRSSSRPTTPASTSSWPSTPPPPSPSRPSTAPPPTCWPPPTPTTMDSARSALAEAPQDLRHQHDGAGDAEGQPGRHHRPSPTSRSPASPTSPASTPHPCGKVAAALIADNRRHLEAGQPRGRRQVRPGQGDQRRGRRRLRLRHRRRGRRRPGRHRPGPARRRRGHDLPDRAADAVARTAGLAQQFVDLVLSDQGRQVLQDAGFGKP